MIVLFDKSFIKSLDKLKDKQVKERLKGLIVSMEVAHAVVDLPNLKQIKGHPGCYRIRIGDYRVGFELTATSEILLILVAHRKEIYKRFP